jgi:hypothetical protein
MREGPSNRVVLKAAMKVERRSARMELAPFTVQNMPD